jgi:hypothetical protein
MRLPHVFSRPFRAHERSERSRGLALRAPPPAMGSRPCRGEDTRPGRGLPDTSRGLNAGGGRSANQSLPWFAGLLPDTAAHPAGRRHAAREGIARHEPRAERRRRALRESEPAVVRGAIGDTAAHPAGRRQAAREGIARHEPRAGEGRPGRARAHSPAERSEPGGKSQVEIRPGGAEDQ